MGRQITIQFKINAVRDYIEGEPRTYEAVAKVHGVTPISLSRWVKQHHDGLLSYNNAYSVSHKPKEMTGIELIKFDINKAINKCQNDLDKLQSEYSKVTHDYEALNKMLGVLGHD